MSNSPALQMVRPLKLICFSSILMKIGEVVVTMHGHWALEHHQVTSKSDLTIYKLGAGEFGLRMKTNTIYTMVGHSSEKRGLRSTFLSGESLQNLPYL